MTHTYEETVERLVKAKEHGVSMRRVALRSEIIPLRIQRVTGSAAGFCVRRAGCFPAGCRPIEI